MRRRTIGIVTTARAEYGVLRSLIRETHADPELELHLLVSGTHLSHEHGYTVREIEADGWPIRQRLPILVSGGDEGAALRTIGVAALGLASIFDQERPDVLVVAGDRTEVIAFGLAALLWRVPLAHLHGGEVTLGAIDDVIRHSLTRMATFHFAATAEYAKRIASFGENPERIFTVGAPALDGLAELTPVTRAELFRALDLEPERRTALVTFHPPSYSDPEAIGEQVEALLTSLDRSGLQVVFTGANADPHGALINARVRTVAQEHPGRFRFVTHLGGEQYFHCLRHLDLVIGNSSSGLIEAPSFGIPVVNIGDRQEGRVRAANVIDVAPTRAEIDAGISRALSDVFRQRCAAAVNPYAPSGPGGIGKRIKEILKHVPLEPGVVRKHPAPIEAGCA